MQGIREAKLPIIARAKRNAVRMLDLRGIEGDDAPIDQALAEVCPGVVWAIRRGADWAVVMVNDASKQVAMAIADYCRPPNPPESPLDDEATDEPEPREPPDHPPIANCIVIYVNKCTVIAGKEMDALETVAMERFSVEEVAKCPLDLEWQDEYTLLTDPAEIADVKARYGPKGMAEIWTTDMTQRWFNAPIGSIYRTVKRWKGLQPDVGYRVVTEPSA